MCSRSSARIRDRYLPPSFVWERALAVSLPFDAARGRLLGALLLAAADALAELGPRRLLLREREPLVVERAVQGVVPEPLVPHLHLFLAQARLAVELLERPTEKRASDARLATSSVRKDAGRPDVRRSTSRAARDGSAPPGAAPVTAGDSRTREPLPAGVSVMFASRNASFFFFFVRLLTSGSRRARTLGRETPLVDASERPLESRYQIFRGFRCHAGHCVCVWCCERGAPRPWTPDGIFCPAVL